MSSINAGTTAPTALTLTGTTDGTLDLATGGTTRMTIDGSGNVGIGATPLSVCRFYVVGSDTTNGNYSVIFRNSATTNLFYVQNDGGLSTGTADASPYYNTTGSSEIGRAHV